MDYYFVGIQKSGETGVGFRLTEFFGQKEKEWEINRL
jgi:hypothetical protein